MIEQEKKKKLTNLPKRRNDNARKRDNQKPRNDKEPKMRLARNFEYYNLNRLIDATNPDTINKYLTLLFLNKQQIQLVNKFRKALEISLV